MDLYKYFQPHHNPRLRSQSIRHQEIGELIEANIELGKACERAFIRQRESPVETLKKEDLAKALSYLHNSLTLLEQISENHPGDDDQELKKMMDERKEAPGWENWARLLKERFKQSSI